MPYVQASPLEDEKNKQLAQAPNVSGGVNFATNVPGQESSQKKSSGQYANLQSYLDVNQDQAAAMGQNVASKVEEKGKAGQSGIESLSKNQGTIEAYDPNKVLGNLQGITSEDKTKYKDIKTTGGYSGPKSLSEIEGIGEVETKARQGAVAAKGASTEQGQQELLKETYARPNYSGGQAKLDQVLLGGSDVGRQALQDVSSKYSGLEDLFKAESNKVGSAINKNIETSLANKQAFVPAEQAALSNLLNPIQARAQDINLRGPEEYNKIKDLLASDTLPEDVITSLGLNKDLSLYDMNLATYLNPNQTQVGLNEAANLEERQKYQALKDLFGDPSMSLIEETGKSITPYTFDKEQFEKDQEAKKLDYYMDYTSKKGEIPLKAAFLPERDKSYIQGIINTYTPIEIENIKIPELKNSIMNDKAFSQDTVNVYKGIVRALEDSLNSWKDSRKINRKIVVEPKKSGPKSLDSESFGGN